MNVNYIILILIYLIFGGLSIINEYKSLKKRKRVDIFDFFKLYYLFIYCIVPICSLIMLTTGESAKLKAFKYLETDNIYFKYTVCFLAIFFYLGLNRVYYYFKSKNKMKEKKDEFIIVPSKSWFYVGNLVILLGGWIALLLYTKVYGSIFGIFKYAPLIRDNIFPVNNSFSFMQPFTQVLMYSSLNYMILLRNMKNKTMSYKIITLILSLMSFLGTFVVLIASDGRMLILGYLLIICYYLFNCHHIKFKKINKKKIITALSLSLVFFFLLFNMDNVTHFIREGEFKNTKSNYNVVRFISKEFSYTYVNNLNILDRLIIQKNVDIRIDDNVLSTLVTFLPRRYKKAISMDMFRYNTSFTKNAIGQIPTDLLTASFYSLSYIGIIVFIFWIPFLINKIENIFMKYKKLNDYYIILYAFFGIYLMLRMVAYYDFSSLLFGRFALITSYIVLILCKWKKLSKINDKIYKIINNFNFVLLKSLDFKIFRIFPDKIYLKIKYLFKMNRKLNLKNPQTFNEKLQWLKLYDRKAIYTKMVDKYEAKDYIKDLIGSEYIIPTIGIYDEFEEIDFSKLPDKFVIKCTHDSGGLVVCEDKSKLDINEVKTKITNCLNNNYYWIGREWPYKDVKPRIIIEEFLECDDLIEYKFFCFNGKPEYLYIVKGKAHTAKREGTFYSVDLKNTNIVRTDISLIEGEIEKPKNYTKMVNLAKTLSKKTNFLRVDFYNIDGKIYCGELTFFPGSGFIPFETLETDLKLGKLLKIKGWGNEK